MSLLTLSLYPERFIPPQGSIRVIRHIDPFDPEPELIADEEYIPRPNKRPLVELALQAGCTSLKAIIKHTGMSKGGIRVNMELILNDGLVEIQPKRGKIAAVYKWIGDV